MGRKTGFLQGTAAISGGGLLVMLENEPADVASRLSHWYEFWRGAGTLLPPAPDWLTSPSADTLGYLVGFGLVTLAVAPTLAGWMRRSPATPDLRVSAPEQVTIDQSVTSHGQSGGVTARTVINQAPKPTVREVWQKFEKLPNGTYCAEIGVEIISPYVPKEVQFQFHGGGIIDVGVGMMGTGPLSLSKHIGMGDIDFVNIMHPSGVYTLKITTSDERYIRIASVFRE